MVSARPDDIGTWYLQPRKGVSDFQLRNFGSCASCLSTSSLALSRVLRTALLHRCKNKCACRSLDSRRVKNPVAAPAAEKKKSKYPTDTQRNVVFSPVSQSASSVVQPLPVLCSTSLYLSGRQRRNLSLSHNSRQTRYSLRHQPRTLTLISLPYYIVPGSDLSPSNSPFQPSPEDPACYTSASGHEHETDTVLAGSNKLRLIAKHEG
ncbi:hypothetical protein BJY04DRAFT_122307 [Aspergillus karnatakaensis]|uniref:uncharacterized protein n=1 Tax=Aspergillus karnatakaensis TaxID=1810916 RepID=UPI003CCD2DF2